MIRTDDRTLSHTTKVEYGDFQTPLELAERVCQQLIDLGVKPDLIIEPSCGVGSFIEATSRFFPSAHKIIGVEINSQHLNAVEEKKILLQDERISLQHSDFFQFDWASCVSEFNGEILVVGNFPWVTNSKQGKIGGENMPKKSNFQNHSGLDAITGKSNFDISEWMLIQVVQWLQDRNASLAMLCKTSVSRKLLRYFYQKKLSLASCATYKIDAKKYFGATVEACLLFCRFDINSKNYACNVFNGLGHSEHYQIGYHHDVLIRDITSFEKLQQLYDASPTQKWRSGIKHDCSSVMEFRKIDDTLVNGLGEFVDLEETYLFPLIKGSSVAQNRLEKTDRYILVTQRFIGESTACIKTIAPKTWNYLESHGSYLDNRKSKIYQNNPRFSIFGVGSYSFKPWKIGICGLYKKLEFRLIGKLAGKPAVFDDTIYFLSFDDEKTASKTFDVLISSSAIDFYASLIFWDEKRPIKASILNSLNLTALIDAGDSLASESC